MCFTIPNDDGILLEERDNIVVCPTNFPGLNIKEIITWFLLKWPMAGVTNQTFVIQPGIRFKIFTCTGGNW